jgi:hypothetical protein
MVLSACSPKRMRISHSWCYCNRKPENRRKHAMLTDDILLTSNWSKIVQAQEQESTTGQVSQHRWMVHTLTTRAAARSIIGGKGAYSYIRVLPDGWKRLFLRYVNMNIWTYTPPPPPPIIASSYGPVDHCHPQSNWLYCLTVSLTRTYLKDVHCR